MSKLPEGPLKSKRCIICGETKTVSSFFCTLRSNGRTYYDSYCKPCSIRKRREYRQAKPSKRLIRKRNLKLLGMTIERFDAMEAAQGGVCAICKQPERHVSHVTRQVRRLSVDHCHRTNHIRGLLCSLCNRAIALFHDDPAALRAAAEYLEANTPIS